MTGSIGPYHRPVRSSPVEQPPLMTANDQVVDSRLLHNLRHLQGPARYIHVKVRQGLIPVESLLQPAGSQIKLTRERFSRIHFLVRLYKSSPYTDTPVLNVLIKQRLRFRMPVQILHHDGSLLNIHLKRRILLKSFKKGVSQRVSRSAIHASR